MTVIKRQFGPQEGILFRAHSNIEIDVLGKHSSAGDVRVFALAGPQLVVEKMEYSRWAPRLLLRVGVNMQKVVPAHSVLLIPQLWLPPVRTVGASAYRSKQSSAPGRQRQEQGPRRRCSRCSWRESKRHQYRSFQNRGGKLHRFLFSAWIARANPR